MKEYERELKDLRKELAEIKLLETVNAQTLKAILNELQRGNRQSQA